jgi:hypothetical protein
VEALKDTINQMITNLKETTLRNQDQDWLKSNLATFTQMLQGQRDLNSVTKRILSELAQVVTAHYGAVYILDQEDTRKNVKLKLVATYGYPEDAKIARNFRLAKGWLGNAYEKERILITKVPSNYIKISSGLKSKPANLIILPYCLKTMLRR